MEKAIKYSKALRIMKTGLNFFEFENEIIVKFGDMADELNIQELYTSYYL